MVVHLTCSVCHAVIPSIFRSNLYINILREIEIVQVIDKFLAEVFGCRVC